MRLRKRVPAENMLTSTGIPICQETPRSGFESEISRFDAANVGYMLLLAISLSQLVLRSSRAIVQNAHIGRAHNGSCGCLAMESRLVSQLGHRRCWLHALYSSTIYMHNRMRLPLCLVVTSSGAAGSHISHEPVSVFHYRESPRTTCLNRYTATVSLSGFGAYILYSVHLLETDVDRLFKDLTAWACGDTCFYCVSW